MDRGELVTKWCDSLLRTWPSEGLKDYCTNDMEESSPGTLEMVKNDGPELNQK